MASKDSDCPAGQVPIVLTQNLYNVVKTAVDSATLVGTNRQICLSTAAAQLLLQATAIGIGPSEQRPTIVKDVPLD